MTKLYMIQRMSKLYSTSSANNHCGVTVFAVDGMELISQEWNLTFP